MKKYVHLLILFAFCNTINAQYFSDDNFIYTARPKKAVSGDYFKTLKKEEMTQNVTYFDGLGRPVQTIAIGQGGDGSDIITAIEYDGFGRQEKEYLPFSLPNANNQYPRIETQTAINNTLSFYSNEKYNNTANPFSQKKFENSPLNRVLKQAAPGNDWAMDQGHEIKIDYQTNTNEEVRLFEVITTWDPSVGLYDISFWDNGHYDKNELYKMITYDENSDSDPYEKNGSTIEFKNKEGQIVLRRTYNSNQQHDTYYVYDEYGQLTYVIPPKADGVITDEILNNLCFQYKHDERNRLVEKKLPGKQWEFIVYDRLNRVVATGPVNSPFQDDNSVGWLITKYDALGRPIYTGWDNKAADSAGRYILQQEYNHENPILEPSQKSGTIEGILVNDSKVPSSGFKILSATYYENHNFPKAATKLSTIQGQQVLFTNTRLVTGGWTRVPTKASEVLGETNSIFYDVMRRPIQNYIVNHLGGYTYIDDRLDFTGKKLYSATNHKYSSSTLPLNIGETFTYTQQDRLLTHTHKTAYGNEQLLAENSYDALGLLTNKKVGNTNANPLQKIDYKYNIRGWLTNINNTDNLLEDNDPRDLFAFKINYNKHEGLTFQSEPLYNGNIAETFWATNSDGGVMRGYGYRYDKLNRLQLATYQTPKLTDNKNYFGEFAAYDKNGNITNMQRKSIAGTSSNPYIDDMDILGYFYKDNSNQLMKVTDSTNNPQGFKEDSDGRNDTEDDYAYDDNGSLIKDQNKNITEITYNHLNLTKKITFATGNTIEYIYNATGQKLEKNVTENGVVTNTKYLTGFQYKNNVLQFFPTAEGYVRNTSTNPATYTFGYVFNYTDHLGNVRVSYAQNAQKNSLEILEENNYYPFGLKHQGYNTDNKQIGYNYKYNGKELQDELGLNFYDYAARNYDPALGRWMNIDPKAETSRRFSPFAYALNNPVYFIDPDGMQADDWVSYVGHDGQQQVVYDEGVHSKKDAEAKYKNVIDSFKSGSITGTAPDGNSSYSYQLNENGSVTDVGAGGTSIEKGFTTAQGTYVGENKSTLKQLSSVASNSGDVAVVAGSLMVLTGVGAPIGAGLIYYGGIASNVGTGMDILNDVNTGNFSTEKTLTKGAMMIAPSIGGGALKSLGAPETAGTLLNLEVMAVDKSVDLMRETKTGMFKEN